MRTIVARNFRVALFAIPFALLLAFPARAQSGFALFQGTDLVPSTQYYTEMIGGGLGTIVKMTGGDNVGQERSNNGYYGPIQLGFPIQFFGQTYTELWANTNGNITFVAGSEAALPPTPPGMSVFFADADTRPSSSGLVWLRQESKRTIITWDNVGYFDSHGDRRNSFQLVLHAPDTVPTGEGQIGFFFKDMGWETGDAQGGTGGFGPPPPAAVSAAVGLGDGVANGLVLWGSTYPGIAATVANHHVWFDLDSAGVPHLMPIETFVPAAAHTPGPGGTNWVTDLVVHNASAAAATFSIGFLSSGVDNSSVTAVDGGSVEPGQSLGIVDVAAGKLGSTAWRGGLLISSASRDLRVTSRTYNVGELGTFGQTIPGGRASEAIPEGTKGYLIGLSENPASRTNVGFLNPSRVTVSVEAKLFSATGIDLGQLSWSLPPFGQIQEDRIFTKVTSDPITLGRIEVTSTGGPLFAYASIIDEHTSDPTFVAPIR